MGIGENIAANILQYKRNHKFSTVELASELHLSVSTTQEYLNGDGNPRANTLEMIAQQMNISVIDLISSPSPGVALAQNMIHTASELAALSPAKREKGIHLFMEMIKLLDDET